MQKTAPKKHQIFEKWDDFENRPSCKGYSPCKGYSLCTMVILGQKLKMRKTCERPFNKNIRVVLCKKPLQKNTKYSRNELFWKSTILQRRPCKGYSLWKMVSLGQKLKMPKTCEKLFHNDIRVVLCKKPLEKKPNIREMRQFWKSAIFQRL